MEKCLSRILSGRACGHGHAQICEENNLLSEFNILASAPCSGPYEITGAMADTIFVASYSNPVILYICWQLISLYIATFTTHIRIF